MHLHGELWRQEYFVAVDRRLEAHTLFRELAHACQRENLEATRIRQDRATPVHEFVQPAVLADDRRAGPQHQVEGIAEDDLGTVGGNLFGRDALDRAVGSDGHECRCLYRTASKREEPVTRGPAAIEDFELHSSAPGVTNIESP